MHISWRQKYIILRQKIAKIDNFIVTGALIIWVWKSNSSLKFCDGREVSI